MKLYSRPLSPYSSIVRALAYIKNVPLKVTSVAKTIADCFKYRHKIGTAIAIEALHDARKQRRLDLDELWRMANVCRMSRVILPYLETLT